MDEMKHNSIVPVNADGPLPPNRRNDIGRRPNADFSVALARANAEAAPAFPPIAKRKQSQNILALSPVMGTAHPGAIDSLNERALGLRAYRQELLASNIANADTPGYKALDFDINAALRNGLSATSNLPLQYHVPNQSSIDGNTVEMDVERAKFAMNALMYEYHVDRVKGHYKDMDDLLKNTPY